MKSVILNEMLQNDELPLVSISIPNYNYGHFLEYCFESVLNQTYPNLEISFNDNQSTDDSYDIAQKYRKIFLERGIYFHLYQNKRNVGSDRNSMISTSRTEGNFIYTLASDDAVAPTFIEHCVDVFVRYPEVGMVMTHREEIDLHGNITQTPPFYNTSCVIDGESQAAVFMMAGVAIPGQRIIRRSVLNGIGAYKYTFQVAGDWFDNFLFAMKGDVAYIKEPLCQYRVHPGNETNVSERNLLGIFEHYQIINSFVSISKAFDMEKPAERIDAATKKLGDMCLRYSLKMLKLGLDDMAKKYLQLAPIFKDGIENSEIYSDLSKCLSSKGEQREKAITRLDASGIAARAVSYDPPEGFVKLSFE